MIDMLFWQPVLPGDNVPTERLFLAPREERRSLAHQANAYLEQHLSDNARRLRPGNIMRRKLARLRKG